MSAAAAALARAGTAVAGSDRPRIDVLDTLRGVALLGILAVNLPWFAASVHAPLAPAGPADAVAFWLVALFGQAKLFVLFSFLFGYGLAVQMDGAARRGDALGARYARRLVGLFALGLVHAVFLFVGDILTLYAVLGAGLWLVRGWPVRRLVGLGAAALAVSVASYALVGAAFSLAPAEDPALAAEAAAAVGGSFLDGARQRLRDLPLVLPFLALFNGPTAFAAFAVGLAAGRLRLAERPDPLGPRGRRALPWALAVGLAGNAAYATQSLAMAASADVSPWAGALVLGGLALSAPALSFVYLAAVVEAERSGRFERVLAPLRRAGRMSLTVYMGGSLPAAFVFGGWGLGLFGRVGPLETLLLAPVLFGLSLGFCAVWLRFFRFGPEEWLLRSWTLGRWEPLRRDRARHARAPR